MKTVNYFGYDITVPKSVNYLAFELIESDNKEDGYILHGYINKPEWVKSSKVWFDSKLWFDAKNNRIPTPKYTDILQEIRNSGVKPSQSLLEIKND